MFINNITIDNIIQLLQKLIPTQCCQPSVS